ncbi:hypothetical protein U3A59_08695 [Algoriphagus sp. E1-3-M2]|nr:hypothetical protein [Algoriphagus sp. E1-3-M2]
MKSTHRDFEDAIQIGYAESMSNINYIVSQNLKDFKILIYSRHFTTGITH